MTQGPEREPYYSVHPAVPLPGEFGYARTLPPRVSSPVLGWVLLGLGGLDYRPEDWTPVDSLAWLKAMAWDLRGNLEDEIDRALALADRSAADVRDLYPAYPFAEHAPIVGQGAVVDGVFEQDATTGGTRNPRRPAFTAARKGGRKL